jgi:hypothetical protein
MHGYLPELIKRSGALVIDSPAERCLPPSNTKAIAFQGKPLGQTSTSVSAMRSKTESAASESTRMTMLPPSARALGTSKPS